MFDRRVEIFDQSLIIAIIIVPEHLTTIINESLNLHIWSLFYFVANSQEFTFIVVYVISAMSWHIIFCL